MRDGAQRTAEEVTEGLDLSGTTWLVTGCNSGLGLETARVLGLRGGRVIGTARTLEKAAAALSGLGLSDAVPLACELSSLETVQAAVDAVRAQGVLLDGIIANAGIMALPTLQQQDGVELQFFTNHVGHALLVMGLMARLAPAGRVVMVSSEAHRMAAGTGLELDNLSGERDYHPWRMYARSKLANILFARALSRRLPGPDQTANAVHPGVIQTNLARHVPDPEALFARLRDRTKSIAQGAATQCLVATHPGLAGIHSTYFSDCAPLEPIPEALDDALAEQLWTETLRLIASSLPQRAPTE